MNTHNVTPRLHIRHLAGIFAVILPLFAVAAAPAPTVEVRLQVFLDGKEVSVQKMVSAGAGTAAPAVPVAAAPPMAPRTASAAEEVDYLATDKLGRSLIP